MRPIVILQYLYVRLSKVVNETVVRKMTACPPRSVRSPPRRAAASGGGGGWPSVGAARRLQMAEREQQVDQRNQQRGNETILRGRLGGGSTQQAHLNTKGRGSATCDSSVRQQIPLGLRVSMRNPDERSCHLRRTR